MIKEELLNILKKSDFTTEFITYIFEHFPDDYEMLYEKPYEKDDTENPILKLAPTDRLFETLAQLLTLKNFYIKKEIPLKHLYESIYDLNYRLERYYTNHGIYGLSDNDIRWLTPVFQAKMLDLGSLRFEMAGFSYAEIERSAHEYMYLPSKWKSKFPEGTPIVNVHILKGTDFSPNKVDEALQQAVHFFQNYFPEHEYDYFVCRTWLLYEPLRELLGEDSNIVSFAKRFELIAENQNARQALDRMYGTHDLDEIERMEKVSSLQKIAYQNLDKIGEATGIINKKEIESI